MHVNTALPAMAVVVILPHLIEVLDRPRRRLHDEESRVQSLVVQVFREVDVHVRINVLHHILVSFEKRVQIHPDHEFIFPTLQKVLQPGYLVPSG